MNGWYEAKINSCIDFYTSHQQHQNHYNDTDQDCDNIKLSGQLFIRRNHSTIYLFAVQFDILPSEKHTTYPPKSFYKVQDLSDQIFGVYDCKHPRSEYHHIV